MSDFRAKCTKFNFGWGSASDPAEEAYSAPLARFKGPSSEGRRGGNGGMGGDSFTFCGSMPMAWQYRNEVIES